MHIKTLGAGLAICGVLLGATMGSANAFDPQPDPPGFGIVSINPDQTIRLYVVCWEHVIDGVPPAPCHGDLMFHDMAGNVVAMQTIKLGPGQAAFLDFTPARGTSVVNLAGINPCGMPDPTSGRVLPTAEVFDTASGVVALHMNPQTPRVSLIYNGAPSR